MPSTGTKRVVVREFLAEMIGTFLLVVSIPSVLDFGP